LFYRIPADFAAVCPFNLVLNTLFGSKVIWNCSSDWFKEIVYGRIGLLAGGPMPVESFLFVYQTVEQFTKEAFVLSWGLMAWTTSLV
jgi:hypothetical protein